MDAALTGEPQHGTSGRTGLPGATGNQRAVHRTSVLDNHNVTLTVTTYALYRSQFLYSRIDGRYAAVAGDIRVLMGADTLAHAAAQYQWAITTIMDALHVHHGR